MYILRQNLRDALQNSSGLKKNYVTKCINWKKLIFTNRHPAFLKIIKKFVHFLTSS